MKNFITSLFKLKSKDKQDTANIVTNDPGQKETASDSRAAKKPGNNITEKVIAGLRGQGEIKLYDVIEKYIDIKDLHTYNQFKASDFKKVLEVCSYYFIQTSTKEIEYMLDRLERFSIKRQKEETEELIAWINEKGIQPAINEFIMSVRNKYDLEEIDLAEYKAELKKLKGDLEEKYNMKIEMKELGILVFKTRYEPYMKDTVERLGIEPEEDENIKIKKYIKYFGKGKLVRGNLIRLAMVLNKSADECRDIIKSFIEEENQKKEQKRLEEKAVKEKERLEREAAKEKQRLEKVLSDINEIDAYELIRKFVLSIRAEYNTGKMSNEKYRENLTNMQEYIHYKKGKLIELKDLEDVVNLLENEIYLEEFKAKLGIKPDDRPDEIISRYISYFGSRVFSGENISKLSALLRESKENTEKLIQDRQKEIALEAKMKSFENALNGKKQQYTLEFIDDLNGYEFEDYLAELFEDFGYEVERTSYSGDFGADIIIKDKSFKAVIQAKNYTGNVGNKAVQEIVSAMSYYKCDKAMVITNSYYTNQAVELARTTGTTLIDRDGLEKIIEKGKMYFIENYL